MLREAHSIFQVSRVPFSTLLLKYPGDLNELRQLPKVLNLQTLRAQALEVINILWVLYYLIYQTPQNARKVSLKGKNSVVIGKSQVTVWTSSLSFGLGDARKRCKFITPVDCNRGCKPYQPALMLHCICSVFKGKLEGIKVGSKITNPGQNSHLSLRPPALLFLLHSLFFLFSSITTKCFH